MLQPGRVLDVTIEKPAAGGRMIARVEGQVVLVAGAIPGEQVRVRIERVGRGVAYAQVETVETPSADRRPVTSDPLCGGCVYSHITYARQLEVKALVIADALSRIGRLAPPAQIAVAPSPETGYRVRARLHVRDGRIGFFREGTHEICEARSTRQLRDETCDVLDRVAAGLRSLGMAGVHEIEVSENLDASQRVVHLERLPGLSPRALSGLALSDGLTGLTTNSTAGPSRVTLVRGEPHVVDTLRVDHADIRLRRHVLAFFQGNRFLLQPLVEHVIGHVSPGDRVIDLYAGTGLFSVAAAATGAGQVTAVEGDPSGAADLVFNAQPVRERMTAVRQSVEDFVAQPQEAPAVLIMDPPRTGLSKEALQGAIGLGARTVVYVSCDVATLARDARQLVDAGYAVDQVSGFDLFPSTPHVETVITFRR